MMNTTLFSLLMITSFSPKDYNQIFAPLDSLLQQKEVFVKAKEERIDQLKLRLQSVRKPSEAYLLNRMIYQEYSVFNADSALHYVDRNRLLAEQTHNREWIFEYKISQAFLFRATGLIKEAMDVMNSIRVDELNRSQLSKYYRQMNAIYQRIRDYSTDNAELHRKYEQLQKSYVDSIVMTGSPDDPRYLHNIFWKYIGTPKALPYQKAMEAKVALTTTRPRQVAIMANDLAVLYKRDGNEERYLHYLVLSACADIRSVNRDAGSLRELAGYLFRHGDLNRAYTYINDCVNNAQVYHNRVRFIEASKLQNQIQAAYQKNIARQQERLHIYSIVVSTLSLILIFSLLFILRQMKRQHRLNRKLSTTGSELEEANERLLSLNGQLQDVNRQLQDVNDELRESNHVKEEYIGYVFNICSTYIGKLDDYRKSINRKLKVGQIAEAKELTDSSSMADNELKEFYKNFDTVFLQIYPNFIDDFNTLLQPEARFVQEEGESLSTELRIHALLRLGIADSVKIAGFLHCSPQTVYNTRLKTRNKALIPKEEFAYAVRHLGSYNT